VRVGSGVELLQYDLRVLLQQLVVGVLLHERLLQLAVRQVGDVVESGSERFGIDSGDSVIEDGEAVLGQEHLLFGDGHDELRSARGEGRPSPQ